MDYSQSPDSRWQQRGQRTLLTPVWRRWANVSLSSLNNRQQTLTAAQVPLSRAADQA